MEQAISKIERIEEEPKTPAQVLSLAIERGVAPEVLNKMLDVQERWEKRQAQKEFVSAMTRFKAVAPAVLKKGSEVKFDTSKGLVHYKYANLGDIIQEITSVLSQHELSVSWETGQDEKDRVVVTCHITHVRGHRESVTLKSPPDISGNKNPIQAIGSAVTYLQRYTLLAALGLATADQDDDGMATSRLKPEPPEPSKSTPPTDTPKPKSFRSDPELFFQFLGMMENAETIEDLKKIWSEINKAKRRFSTNQFKELIRIKNEIKETLMKEVEDEENSKNRQR